MTENRPEYGLKPCKCGAIPVIDFEYYDCKWFYIKCQNCGLFFSILASDDETALVSAWNDRPIEDALRAQIADLTARNKHLEWDLEQAERRGDDLARRLEGKA